MADHLMIVLSNSNPEMEPAFREWYDDHLVQLVTRLEGFASAELFELAPDQVEDGSDFRFLAVYRVPEDRLASAQESIRYMRRERAEALAEGREPVVTPSPAGAFLGAAHTWFFSPAQ
jgi:hypothetical protein